jgi:hypothetical protein
MLRITDEHWHLLFGLSKEMVKVKELAPESTPRRGGTVYVSKTRASKRLWIVVSFAPPAIAPVFTEGAKR